MHRFDLSVVLLAILLMLIGLLLSLWPLVPAGVALLVFEGHVALGVTSGLVADLIFGAPLGMLSYVHFPFLLFAVACVVLRVVAVSVVLPRGGANTL